MNPFDAARSVAGLWEKSGEAYLKAGTDLLSGMATWMGEPRPDATGSAEQASPADPRAAGSVARPAALAAAQRAFERSWATAEDVARTAAANLSERPVTVDAAARAMLNRILDPGAWFSGTGSPGEPAASLGSAGGSADLLADGHIVAVLDAWAMLRQRNLEHGTVMLEAWMQAAGAFSRQLSRAPGPAEAGVLAEQWIETAGRSLEETGKSDVFRASQRALLDAAARLKGAQTDLNAFSGDVYGYPTRAELDALGRSVEELRQEVRTLQRAARLPRVAPDGGANLGGTAPRDGRGRP